MGSAFNHAVRRDAGAIPVRWSLQGAHDDSPRQCAVGRERHSLPAGRDGAQCDERRIDDGVDGQVGDRRERSIGQRRRSHGERAGWQWMVERAADRQIERCGTVALYRRRRDSGRAEADRGQL